MLSREPEDRGDDIHEPRDGLEAVQFLRTNPALLDVFPIEAHPAFRGVEEEGMDDVARRAISSEGRISRSAEGDCPDDRLLPTPRAGRVLRIFAALEVAGGA